MTHSRTVGRVKRNECEFRYHSHAVQTLTISQPLLINCWSAPVQKRHRHRNQQDGKGHILSLLRNFPETRRMELAWTCPEERAMCNHSTHQLNTGILRRWSNSWWFPCYFSSPLLKERESLQSVKQLHHSYYVGSYMTLIAWALHNQWILSSQRCCQEGKYNPHI